MVPKDKVFLHGKAGVIEGADDDEIRTGNDDSPREFSDLTPEEARCLEGIVNELSVLRHGVLDSLGTRQIPRR